jgi:hypothetical protein
MMRRENIPNRRNISAETLAKEKPVCFKDKKKNPKSNKAIVTGCSKDELGKNRGKEGQRGSSYRSCYRFDFILNVMGSHWRILIRLELIYTFNMIALAVYRG